MSSQIILRGSHREHPAGSIPVGTPAPDQLLRVTIVLRRRETAPESASHDTHFSHHELASKFGADSSDVALVEKFAHEHGLSVDKVNMATRTATLSGKTENIAKAFGANFELRQLGNRTLRTRSGELAIPAYLNSAVIAVLGLDERPVAVTNRQFRANAAFSGYTPGQVAELYNFPTNTGKNQTIGIIELGGGFNSSDLSTYWSKIGVNEVSVTAVSVDGTNNSPIGDPDSADGEVVLDIEVAGGVAPDAQIAVYFSPNTDQGFLDAINTAIHDTVNRPSVISISWGAAEDQWTSQAMDAFNAAFHDAALLGISVCAASGDNGSSDGDTDGRTHVDFPASSPWVLACGGTRLTSARGAIKSETVWNDGADGGATGGGVSSHFSKPAYQKSIAVPKPWGTANRTGRGVPDVAGVADPETGYSIIVDGQEGVIGGTSSVAPLWAGLIALLNEELGKNAGWLHRKLYGVLAENKALNDITTGNNGAFNAGPGWDPCTGLGSPNGKAILALLK